VLAEAHAREERRHTFTMHLAQMGLDHLAPTKTKR
jgi:hypothetical protein